MIHAEYFYIYESPSFQKAVMAPSLRGLGLKSKEMDVPLLIAVGAW
jgi:hypothetical protein